MNKMLLVFVGVCCFADLASAFTSCTVAVVGGVPITVTNQQCASGHLGITVDALSVLHLPAGVIARIAAANMGVDQYELYPATVSFGCFVLSSPGTAIEYKAYPRYRAREHFDRSGHSPSDHAQAFAAGLQELSTQRNLFISKIHAAHSNSCSEIGPALDALGRALHGLQDAYSHSNYIEESAAVQAQYDNAVRHPDLMLPLPAGMLLTGYDPSAGTPETPTADPYPHCTHSKDFPGKNADSSLSDYNRAYGAALAASALFVSDLILQLGSDWNKVTSLSGCPPLIDVSGQIVTSNDPNDKVGSLGIGTAKFVSGGTPLRYSIYFDNQPTASASAQTVVVTDPLDKARVDLFTLTLGPISFVNSVVTPPTVPLATLGLFKADVDLRPTQNLIARITASLDQTAGVMAWKFQSIDPLTGQPTTDPLAGFLPPGTEASVSFTIQSRVGLTTGSATTNQATVIFDVNPPLNTPAWLNTLDNTPPTSKVSALSASQNSTSFAVNWTGTDLGSGIQDYTLFVSDNGSPFTAWLTNVAETTALYHGIVGHTYGFNVTARDLTGNVESTKTSAEATTTIAASPTCASNYGDQVAVVQGGFRYNNGTKQFAQTISLTNTSTAAVSGPLSIALDSLSSNATLANANGKTSCSQPVGSPYINIDLGSSGQLSPGQTVSGTLQFINPTNGGIVYVPRVLAGLQGR